jgi:hypothetical protein
MNPFDAIIPVIDWVTNLKGIPLVIALLIAVGYLLKMTPFFSNRFIPFVNCLLLGPALTLLLVKWPEPGQMEEGVLWAMAAAWVTAYSKGMFIAVIVWAMHGVVLKRIIDKYVPAWNLEEKEEPKQTVDPGATQTAVQ